MAEPQIPTFVCSEADCKVAETGRCMDGLDPATCPKHTVAEAPLEVEVEETEAEVEAEESLQEKPGLPIHSGEALGAVEARVVTRSVPSTLILAMGGVGCGKTTLLASMYERLRLARTTSFRFRGSRTLIGFERRY